MNDNSQHKLVYTIPEKCRVCYTCVRECPAKAIRIANGQAEVIHERCIGCGNCVKVCSQHAKTFLRNEYDVIHMLKQEAPVVALLAPSFPVEFYELDDYRGLVGALKRVGFSKVVEVAFGAELVARKYKQLYEKNEKPFITSDCPAITYFVRQYYPDLTRFLAPIASPMVATARVVKDYYGNDIKLVFIGPCIAKKLESSEIDVGITFKELRALFDIQKVDLLKAEPEDFDFPKSYKASIFPVNFGLSQTAGKYLDLVHDNLIVAQGKEDMQQAIRYFASSDEHINLELLCCEGCIMGPGISHAALSKFERKTLLMDYARQRMKTANLEEFEQSLQRFGHLDLSVVFTPSDRRIQDPPYDRVEEVLKKMGKTKASDMLNCGACGYATCIEHAIAIVEGIAETEMCLPFTIESLHKTVNDLAQTNEKLTNAQIALKQAEKLAHMGQLSAGIAHELNNPLGIIIMYCNLMLEECPPDSPMRKDMEMIVEQGNRCKKIVSGLLNFARRNQVNYRETDLVKLVAKALESVVVPEKIEVSVIYNENPMMVGIDPDQIMQVLINLKRNALDAVAEQMKANPIAGKVEIELKKEVQFVHIIVKDNGTGISEENKAKLFEPFFTTKPIGVGNGLGLPIVYGIVKMHRGTIEIETNDDPTKGPTGTSFIIKLPLNN